VKTEQNIQKLISLLPLPSVFPQLEAPKMQRSLRRPVTKCSYYVIHDIKSFPTLEP